MKKISKIFLVTISIVTILALMVVPAFADSINNDTYSLTYPFANVSWEGIPLSFEDPLELNDRWYDEFDRFRVDNIFVQDGDADFSTLTTGYNPNKTDLRYATMTNGRGIYNQYSLYSIDSFSAWDVIYIDDMMYYKEDGVNDIWANSIDVTFALPEPLASQILSPVGPFPDGNDYFELVFHCDFDGLVNPQGDDTAYSYWHTFQNNTVTYTLDDDNTTLPNVFTISALNPRREQGRGFNEDGFWLVTFKLPIADAISQFKQWYNVGYQDDLLVKNLWCYFEVYYNQDVLVSQLNRIGDHYGSSDFIQDYYDVVYPVEFEDIPWQSLPMHSVTTSIPNSTVNPSDVSLSVYNKVYLPGTVEPVYIGTDVVSWLGNAIQGIFDVELFGGRFSLGTLLYVAVGAGFLIVILKFFAGG